MKKLLRLIKRTIYYLGIEIIVVIRAAIGKPVFLLGTPRHGNLGDQAILDSELSMMKDLGVRNVIYVESSFVRNRTYFLKKIIGKRKIFVHGGGFLGTIWPEEEKMFRKILEVFSDNRIIVFPQTVYFEKDGAFFDESRRAYSSNKNVLFMLREKYSYDFMKKNLKDCNIVLVPDIVLYNNTLTAENKREGCLFCIRNDKEKVEYDYKEIEAVLKEKQLPFFYTDTVIDKNIYWFNRKKELKKKYDEFLSSKIVITDRLHGMVFAFLTKTPCIVLENSSYKVKGLYEWLKWCNYIKMYKKDTIEKDIEMLLGSEHADTDNYVIDFSDIKRIIRRGQ